MDDKIEVSSINTARDTFTNQVRDFIKRFYGQQFTAIQLITVIANEPKYKDFTQEKIKRTVRTVIRQMIDEGGLKEIQVGLSIKQPGIYKATEKKS